MGNPPKSSKDELRKKPVTAPKSSSTLCGCCPLSPQGDHRQPHRILPLTTRQLAMPLASTSISDEERDRVFPRHDLCGRQLVGMQCNPRSKRNYRPLTKGQSLGEAHAMERKVVTKLLGDVGDLQDRPLVLRERLDAHDNHLPPSITSSCRQVPLAPCPFLRGVFFRHQTGERGRWMK